MSIREKGKRILLVSHELTYSGAPRSLFNMAVLLKKQAYDVEVWSLQNGDFYKEFEDAGIKVKIVRDIALITKKEIEKFDIAILNTFFTAHLLSVMQKYIRTILYLREAQNIPDIARDCGLDEENIRKAREIICVSEYAEKFIKQKYNPQNIKVVHNFIEDCYDGKLNFIRNNIVRFIVSGTFEYRKGYDIALEAFNSMPEELKNKTQLHLVGRKPEWARAYWEPLQEKYNDRIIDHGEIKNRQELIDLYRQMNVFVVASRDESCSLVALEGAMLGKAVIISENVGAQYLDKKRKGIYKTRDAWELSRKMCELTSRRELLIRGIEMRRSYKKISTQKVFRSKFLKSILEE